MALWRSYKDQQLSQRSDHLTEEMTDRYNRVTDERTGRSNILTNEMTEPDWVKVLPSARGIWSMVVTLRGRGSFELANSLETGAAQQAEAHLRTRELMERKTTSTVASRGQVETNWTRDRKQGDTCWRQQMDSDTCGEIETGLEDDSDMDECNWESDDHEEENKWSLKVCSKGDSLVKGDEYSFQSGYPLRGTRCPVNVRMLPATPSPVLSAATSPRSLSPNRKCDYKGQENLRPPLPIQDTNACYHTRLKTYDKSNFRWGSPSPSELSDAGFFFIGPHDNVQCFSCETCQSYWKPAEDPWVRHSRRSPSCDYLFETRGTDFISSMINSVEKVNTNTKIVSNNPGQDVVSEFSTMSNGLLNTQAKLRETKTPSSSGWRLDPYKERGVAGNSSKSTTKRKKK